MNLLQAIRRDKPNTIRVGTQNGGNFIYIGRAIRVNKKTVAKELIEKGRLP